MSRTILNAILNQMQILLSETERETLYHELLAYFGLIGGTHECEALENAWKDPYNKREIQEFIKARLKRKQSQREEAIAEVV